MYGVYLDRLFFLNFSLDLLLLLAVKWTLGRTATRARILLSAAFAAAAYCLLFLYAGSIRLKNLWGFGILSIGMTLGAFGYGNPRLFLDSLLTLYGYSCALGGGLLVLRKRIPAFFVSDALTVSLLAALGFVLTGRSICLHMCDRRKQKVYPVSVELNGERWEMTGFGYRERTSGSDPWEAGERAGCGDVKEHSGENAATAAGDRSLSNRRHRTGLFLCSESGKALDSHRRGKKMCDGCAGRFFGKGV